MEWPKDKNNTEGFIVSHGFTVTHEGKRSLMLLAYENFKSTLDYKSQLLYMYAFFDHAYHMRDWLKKFVNITDVDNNWSENPNYLYFKISRDLSLKSKHFRISEGKGSVDDKIGLRLVELKKDGKNVKRIDVVYDNKYIPIEIVMEGVINFWQSVF